MLNLDDDSPQPLANGHTAAPSEAAPPAAANDPVAELMGLSYGGQPSAAAPQHSHASPGEGLGPSLPEASA